MVWQIPKVLQGDNCAIVELEMTDAEALAQCAEPILFAYLSRRPETWDASGMQRLLELISETPSSKFYTVRQGCASGPVRGMTAFLDISEYNCRLEIGWTWLAAADHRTGLNRRIKRLMLDFAFDTLKALRVTLTCDSRNANSQRAIERLGAQREGVMRSYGRMPDGFQRDVIVYSILASDWRTRPADKSA